MPTKRFAGLAVREIIAADGGGFPGTQGYWACEWGVMQLRGRGMRRLRIAGLALGLTVIGTGLASGAVQPTSAGPSACTAGPQGVVFPGDDPAPDTFFGTDHRDVMKGGDGDDTIYGEGGGDCLYGQDGKDAVFGGDGKDLVDGGRGDDDLLGDAGADEISGTTGTDTLTGGSGNDVLKGGDQNDQLTGGAGTDLLNCGGGHDVAFAGSGDTVRKNCERVVHG